MSGKFLIGIIIYFLLFSLRAPDHIQAKTLVFGGAQDLIPYEYTDLKGRAHGFDVNLIKAIANIKGWKVEFRLMEWPSAVRALRRGEIDALLGMIYDEEKDEEFGFSDPHSSIEFAVFRRKNTPLILSLEDLHGKKIGIHEWEESIGKVPPLKGLKNVFSMDMKGLLSALSKGELDAVICPKLIGLHWRHRLNLSNIACQDAPVFLRESCFAVRKENEALVKELNDGLIKLKESGDYFHLGKNLYEGMESKGPFDLFFIFGAIPIIAGIAFIFLKFIRGRRSIRDKLTLSFLTISIPPLLIIGILTYLNEKRIIKEKVGEHLESISELKAEILAQWIEEAKSACRDISRDPILMESIKKVINIYKRDKNDHGENRNVEFQRIRGYLQGLIRIKGYDEAIIINPNGTVILSTDPKYNGTDMSTNPHFIGAMRAMPEEVFIKDIYYSERTKNLCIAFSTRIIEKDFMGRDEKTIGVLVLKADVNRTIYPIIGTWPGMGSSGEIILLRKERDRILFLNNTKHFPDTALKLSFPILSSSEIVDVSLRTLSGEIGIEEFKDYRGVPVLAGSSLVPHTHWVLVTKKDKKEAFFEIDRLLRRNYFIFMGFLLIMTFFSFTISRSIARPIEVFNELVEKVTRGILDVEPDINQKDEIGKLARSFRAMIQSLKERFDRSERLSALGKLSAGLAHEIRTPLTSIKVTIQSLEKQLQLDDDQREDFALVKKEIDRLNENVSRFLDFARPPNPTFRFIDLNLLLRETLNLIQSRMVSGRIEVVTDLEENITKIEGDEKQLRQVFLNLMLNAIEAMPRGGRLKLSSRSFGGKGGLMEIRGEKGHHKTMTEGGFVEVQISDTGEGIPPEYRAYIFDPFFTTKEGGTGLGLSIVFSIIERHNGWIEVESSPNEGTTFKVILPILQEIRE